MQDALQNLLSRKTQAERVATSTDAGAVIAATSGPALPAPIAMMARMLGVKPEDMVAAVQMMAGAATALHETSTRIAALEAQQTLMLQAILTMSKTIALLELRSREAIMPQGADDKGETLL